MTAAPAPAPAPRAVGEPEALTRYVDHVMGMPVSLALRGLHRDDHRARWAWAAVMDDLRDADATFSRYRDDSWVARHGRGEAPAPTPWVREVLALAERASLDSGGAFTTWLPDDGGRPRLDLDGVVKGWAVQHAARHLRSLPGTDHCLAVAGDMVCHTAEPDGPAWRVGISDPRDGQRLLATVDVRRGGVATSGRSERGDHVVDGRTGRPARGLLQATVVAPTLTEADVRATTALALGADASTWLARRGAVSLLVDEHGRTSRTCRPARWGTG